MDQASAANVSSPPANVSSPPANVANPLANLSNAANSELVTFGKYEGQPIAALLADPGYVNYLLKLPSIARRHPRLWHQMSTALGVEGKSSSLAFAPGSGAASASRSAGAITAYRDSPTPRHNRMQNEFLRPAHCLRAAQLLLADDPDVGSHLARHTLRELTSKSPDHAKLTTVHHWRQHGPSVEQTKNGEGHLVVNYVLDAEGIMDHADDEFELLVALPSAVEETLKQFQSEYDELIGLSKSQSQGKRRFSAKEFKELYNQTFLPHAQATLQATLQSLCSTHNSSITTLKSVDDCALWCDQQLPKLFHGDVKLLNVPALKAHLVHMFLPNSIPGIHPLANNVSLNNVSILLNIKPLEQQIDITGPGWGTLGVTSAAPKCSVYLHREFVARQTVRYSCPWVNEVKVTGCMFEEDNWDVKLEAEIVSCKSRLSDTGRASGSSSSSSSVAAVPTVEVHDVARWYLPGSSPRKRRSIYIELKPVLGDDYPCVLRKLKQQRARFHPPSSWSLRAQPTAAAAAAATVAAAAATVAAAAATVAVYALVIDEFESGAATASELRQIFGQDGTKVAFGSEIKSLRPAGAVAAASATSFTRKRPRDGGAEEDLPRL